jgi:CDP-diacylglycerol pyrophosphatase
MASIRRRLRVGAACVLAGAFLAAPACGENPDALRQIVETQCLANWTERHDPSPCERIELGDPPRVESGYALLHDRKGGAHFLLIPTRTVSGIESADLGLPETPNYLASAWRSRDRLDALVGHAIARDAVGLAVNPRHARSQNQLHVHIECLRRDVRDALAKAEIGNPGDGWWPMRIGPFTLEAHNIMGVNLDDQNPFRLLDQRILEEHGTMGEYTLVLAGIETQRGPGFVMLTSPTVAGELLLDSSCAAATVSS